jgi:hypothetical protein
VDSFLKFEQRELLWRGRVWDEQVINYGGSSGWLRCRGSHLPEVRGLDTIPAFFHTTLFELLESYVLAFEGPIEGTVCFERLWLSQQLVIAALR